MRHKCFVNITISVICVIYKLLSLQNLETGFFAYSLHIKCPLTNVTLSSLISSTPLVVK